MRQWGVWSVIWPHLIEIGLTCLKILVSTTVTLLIEWTLRPIQSCSPDGFTNSKFPILKFSRIVGPIRMSHTTHFILVHNFVKNRNWEFVKPFGETMSPPFCHINSHFSGSFKCSLVNLSLLLLFLFDFQRAKYQSAYVNLYIGLGQKMIFLLLKSILRLTFIAIHLQYLKPYKSIFP